MFAIFCHAFIFYANDKNHYRNRKSIIIICSELRNGDMGVIKVWRQEFTKFVATNSCKIETGLYNTVLLMTLLVNERNMHHAKWIVVIFCAFSWWVIVNSKKERRTTFAAWLVDRRKCQVNFDSSFTINEWCSFVWISLAALMS